jgi:choline dehydrogenase
VICDFLVVGGGSAGCALARRLSERPDARVIMVEAGGAAAHPDVLDPSAYYRLWESDVAWRYTSVAQRGTNDRVHYSPRGKGLGGSSAINGMVYFRGARSDYDNWAYAGNHGWSWADVLPAFEAMEAVLTPTVLPERNPLSTVFVNACVQAGHHFTDEFDGGELSGVGWNRSTIRDGQRNSSYRAFLAPVKDRANLSIVLNSRATRILVRRDGCVSGVECVDAARRKMQIVAGETILCCGAFDSPKLLLLSGIGPARDLEAFGIDVRVDLPVGDNLVDHVLLGVLYEGTRPLPEQNAHLTEATLFAGSRPDGYTADIQISFNKEKHFADGYTVGPAAFTIIPGITKPKSRGWVRLRSADPDEPPVINPCHLDQDADVRCLLRGIELAREVGEADAFAPWRAREVAPGPGIDDEPGLRQYIARVSSTWFHPVGTCKMGLDAGAVVSPDLRVYGTQGLSVADASIMPEIVSANTNGAATMIGWKAAEILLSR